MQYYKNFFSKQSMILILFSLLLGCSSPTTIDPIGAYQHSSQTAKGILVGGVAGGLVGGLGNGIGVVPGAVTGVVLGGTLGAYLESHSNLVEQLKDRGAKVAILGDYILIVIPSSHLFSCLSARINPKAYSTLNLVRELIGNYVNMSVTIAAYTNKTEYPHIDRQLSAAQARAVEKYLWRQGVDTRLLVAEGYGGARLVTKNSPYRLNNANYRIEISLEKLPA